MVLLAPETIQALPPCAGNVGNLMQHTATCAIIEALSAHYHRLEYVDMHAMAPLAPIRGMDKRFAAARARLPHLDHDPGATPYERAWRDLAGADHVYPSSSTFVRRLWPGPVRMLLCEVNPATADAIEAWLHANGSPDDRLLRHDWRCLRSADLGACDVRLVQLDPYRVDVLRGFVDDGPRPEGIRPMRPTDFPLLGRILLERSEPVVLQISSYGRMDVPEKRLDVVLDAALSKAGFSHAATLRASSRMKSWIYERGCSEVRALASITDGFHARFLA